MAIGRIGMAALAASAALIGLQAATGLAQTPPSPAAAPPAPAVPAAQAPAAAQAPTLGLHTPQAEGQPSWMEGMTPEQKNSPLHPNVANMLGHPAKDIPVDRFKVPAGFKVELWAGDLQETRSMAVGAKGTVFVGQRTHDGVFAIVDKGGQREVKKILTGLNSPNGIAFANGTLFVAERERILRYDNIEDNLDKPSEAKVVIDGLPHQDGHFWKFMTMGPDGWLYFNQGAPTNITMPTYIQAAILRVQPDKHILEIYAQGVRNSVGMAFSPVTKQLWFTDNGRDNLGDDIPPDELNYAPTPGLHFGYPYCHGGTIADPEFGRGHPCSTYTAPAQNLGPHVAALGLKFYTGAMFPAEYRKQIFIAEHGSWNRSVPIGYRISVVHLDGNRPVKYEPFAEGWLQSERAWGRPVDILEMPDGSLLVSDDEAGVIYRITYKGQ